MKYKLLVLDVDGTLLNNQKEISPRTLAALLKVQQMGVHIVLASGRPTNGVMPIAEKLELNHYGGYILSYNGDLRRMNVAITRARMKLMILGDAPTLTRHVFYKELYEYIRENGQVVDVHPLPPP